MLFTAVTITLIGLAIGSFITAAIWRLHVRSPEFVDGRSGKKKRPTDYDRRSTDLIRGRSMCPNCQHQLAARDLVPLLSWLWLRGKCRFCQQPISVRYPLTELLTAGLFLGSYLVLAPVTSHEWWQFGLWLGILSGLIILALYDLRFMILPDQVMAATIILAATSALVGVVTTDSVSMLLGKLLAGLAAGVLFYIIFAIGRGKWMGGGDVKLAFLMGLILGGGQTLIAMFVAFNIAAILSLVLMAAGRLNRKDLIPFGPFLILGTVIAKLYGVNLINAYVDLLAF